MFFLHNTRRLQGLFAICLTLVLVGCTTARLSGQTRTRTDTYRLLENFDGLNADQSYQVNRYPVEPAQPALCVSDGFVMEIVDLAVVVYSRNGTMVSQPIAMNHFFDEAPGLNGAIVDDPRCYFDTTTHTWFATAFAAEPSLTTSRLDIAVNPSGNPLNRWKIYHIDTSDSTGKDCPCFADGPFFGIDQYNIYLSANEFNLAALAGKAKIFNGAEVYAIAKPPLTTLSSLKYVRFDHLTIDGQLAKTVSPTISSGNPQAAYFISSFSLAPSDHRLGIWGQHIQS